DQQGVIARDRDVVEEYPGIGAAADADPVVLDREALTGAASACPDHQRGARTLDHLVDVDRLHLAGVVDGVGHRRRLVTALRMGAEIGTALLAVVGAFWIDEPALGAVDSQRPAPF